MKKIIFLILLGFFGFISFGCATTKGTADAAKSVGGGLRDDTLALGAAIMKADEWIKEHVW